MTFCSAASAATLLEIAADPKHLGAEIGFLSVLHTWGQNLQIHPHIHCVIPSGGLSPDHQHWIHPRYAFFLPVKVLSKVFRGKFTAGLKRAFHTGRTYESSIEVDGGDVQAIAEDKERWRQWLRQRGELTRSRRRCSTPRLARRRVTRRVASEC